MKVPLATAFVPPATISRADFLRGGSDEAFRETIYTMVLGLDGLLGCRDAFGRAMGLTGSQFAVLMAAAYRQGRDGIAVRDLAAHVRLAAPHVTTEVGRLVRRGLLVKRPHAVDGRSVLVSLSPAGEAAVREVAPLVRAVNDVLFTGIEPPEVDALRGVMHRLVINAERALSELRRGTLLAGPEAGTEPAEGTPAGRRITG